MNILKRKESQPYLLILPVILIMILLYAYPILLIFVQSFQKISVVTDVSKFIGLENFQKMIFNKSFLYTVQLTFYYTVITVILKLLFGFVIALFLSSEMYFSKTLRFLTLIPWAIQQVTVAILWKWILDGNYGYLNYVLIKLGIIKEHVYWLSSPSGAFYAASFVDTWLAISFVSMIFLAGLNSIDKSLYESAMIDGANAIQKFIHITVPGIKKVFFVTATLVTIWTFNSFNVIFVLTGGGPMRTTETLVIKIYQEAFANFDLGASSALSIVVFALLLIFSVIYLKLMMSVDEEV